MRERDRIRVHGRQGSVFSEPLRRMLVAYGWPGNVRELKNAIERALVFSSAVTLAPENFPESVRAADADAGSSLRSLEEIEQLFTPNSAQVRHQLLIEMFTARF